MGKYHLDPCDNRLCTNNCCLEREITLNLLTVDKQNFVCEVTTGGSIKQWSNFLYKLFFRFWWLLFGSGSGVTFVI